MDRSLLKTTQAFSSLCVSPNNNTQLQVIINMLLLPLFSVIKQISPLTQNILKIYINSFNKHLS